MEQGARTRLATALILVVVFASGVLLGLAADSRLSAEPAANESPEASAETGSSMPDSTASADGEQQPAEERRFTYHQVDPNGEQLARIEVIVAEYRERREAIREAIRQEFRDERDARLRELILETREAIKAVLSPNQAAEYQRLLDEWEAEQAAAREKENDRN